ncbi:MAG TPA: hypothetical protein VD969_05215 [Symbiobacteriaceae bacterium]|nr:hypothetical protein [Symbiobacteriaceae bacterium]
MGRLCRMCLAVLIVALAAAGCGKGSTPRSAAGQAPAAPALTLRVPEGQQVAYHLVIDTTFNGRSLNGQALPIDLPLAGKTTLQYDALLRFEQVQENVATVAYTLSGFDVKTEVGAKPVPVGAPLRGDMRFTVKIDTTTGKPIDADVGPGFGGILEKDQLMQMLNQSFANLPQGTAVRPGSSWTAEMPLPLDLPGIQGESKITVTTKYEANETQNGVLVAKLVTTGSGPISMSGDTGGVAFLLKGSLELSATQYIELKTGLQHAMESRTAFTFTQTMKETKSGVSIDTEMESVSKISMTRK